jgi:hypothetical protein
LKDQDGKFGLGEIHCFLNVSVRVGDSLFWVSSAFGRM